MAEPSALHSTTLRGAVLRAWRESRGESQTEFGAHFLNGVSAQTVSAWEVGDRGKFAGGPGPVRAAAIAMDVSTARADAIADLWSAAATPTALAARARWAHNFGKPGVPCWVWLRVPDEDGVAETAVWWGAALQGDLSVSAGAGVLLTFPSNLPNPPLEITFSTRGWADFGLGVPDSGILARLNVDVQDARHLLAPTQPVDPPIEPWQNERFAPVFGSLRKLAENLHIGWSVLLPHLGMVHSERAPVATEGMTIGTETFAGARQTGRPSMLETQLLMEPERVRRLREARGFSREAAAETATALDPRHPVSRGMLSRLETTGQVSGTPNFLSRLDLIYGSDGRLGVEETFKSLTAAPAARRSLRSQHREMVVTYAVPFPDAWIGPVWMQAYSPRPSESAIVDLAWGLWRRRQHLRSGTVLTTRKSAAEQQPLLITIPNGWRVNAGVGASPAAIDVNRGWWPKSLLSALSLLSEAIRTIGDGSKTSLARETAGPAMKD